MTTMCVSRRSAGAGGVAVLLLDQDALDEVPVAGPQQQLVGVVGRDEVPLHASAEQVERLGQLLPKSLGQIGHLLERGGPTREHPAADLPGAHRRLAPFSEPGAEGVLRLVEQGRFRSRCDGG
jgi:hypothetical protein